MTFGSDRKCERRRKKPRPGFNVPNVLGQVGTGGMEADDTPTCPSRIVTCSRALVRTRTCKKEMDRVQDAPKAVEIVTVVKMKTSVVVKR